MSVRLDSRLYCGYETCYDVLGIDRDKFDKGELSKIYRKLARQEEPDRGGDPDLREEAQQKFRKIATAYETLEDDEIRKYYDYYLDHPEERYYNSYQYYRMRPAPTVDVCITIVVAILFVSSVEYFSARQMFEEAMQYAKVIFRNRAIDIARERGLIELNRQGKVKKKQKSGADPEVIIGQIIEEHTSVSEGYKKKSIYDTLLWEIVMLPVTLCRGAILALQESGRILSLRRA